MRNLLSDVNIGTANATVSKGDVSNEKMETMVESWDEKLVR